jgi:phosphoribosyl-ATP pyrophosphohydrolase/phosphoribosyl-AMP cyclohydrolase
VLQRDNAEDLAREFDRYGEVAVIDLDAAMGKGSNIEMIKQLLPLAQCRVGGGIRGADAAVELVSLGAEKIIVSSAALRLPDGSFGVNTAFLEEISAKIGRERLIIAVDSRENVIVVDGWKTSTGLPLVETAQKLEKYAGELLWTCVEREGTMTGINFEALRALRNAVSCKITAAGGVSTLDEVASLAKEDCDVQLGMALYTGKINLADSFIESLDWKKGGNADGNPLLPVIAQSPDGQVLMLGYTDRDALAETFKRGNLCFYSRTRRRFWMKGESSGNVLRVLRLRTDCDHDTLLAVVEPAGAVCHTGAYSCFQAGRRWSLRYLQEVIDERLRTAPAASYTASLSTDKVKRKVMEEAYELCTARTREESVWEAADLFFHAALLASKEGITVDEILAELERRHKEDSAKKKRFEL